MEKENRVVEAEAPVEEQVSQEKPRRFGIRFQDAGRYIRFIVFLVAIGMVYIWNSHVAEKQVKQESQLRKDISDAKAEYKTMHARLSAGTRRKVVLQKVDSLGLKTTSNNIFKISEK